MSSGHRQLTLAETLEALGEGYGRLNDLLGSRGEWELLSPTRCAGWSATDLIFHLVWDAQRSLVALATPAQAEPDLDYVSYWRGWPRRDDAALRNAQFVRASAAALATTTGVVDLWLRTSIAVLTLARAAMPSLKVHPQGHVLTLPDLLATPVVELTIHHLDLLPGLPGPGPGPRALALLRETLDGLLGCTCPGDWPTEVYALKATGRELLTDAETVTLGALVDRPPLTA
jgi:hypothetical protein